MKWLITGGCGFIGRSIVRHLLSQTGNAVRIFDNLSIGTREDLEKISDFTELDEEGTLAGTWEDSVALFVGDILNEKQIASAAINADIVVHLAANTGVPQSVANPAFDCRANVVGTLNVLEASRRAGIKRFVFASSGAPLGVQTPPLNEEMSPHPASPYGASKLAGEGYCSAYFHSFGLETVALRFGNVYGEGSGHKSSVVAKFIKQALSGQALEIFGDGGQTRDFIHISDIVSAILKAAEVPGIGGEIFQIATERETTVSEMTMLLLESLEAEGVVNPGLIYTSTRDGDVMRNFSDTSKAWDRLGWRSRMKLKEGLRRTVHHFSESEAVGR